MNKKFLFFALMFLSCPAQVFATKLWVTNDTGETKVLDMFPYGACHKDGLVVGPHSSSDYNFGLCGIQRIETNGLTVLMPDYNASHVQIKFSNEKGVPHVTVRLCDRACN